MSMLRRSQSLPRDVVVALVAALLLAVLLIGSARADETSDLIARWEGVWSGDDNTTPIGPIPMAFHFKREDDGSLHAHSAQSATTWIDLRFYQDEEGHWLLSEAAAMDGVGFQQHTLSLVERDGEELVWAVVDRPDYLVVRTRHAGETLVMWVRLRGTDHVEFNLNRMEGPGADRMAGQLAAVQGEWPSESAEEPRLNR